MTRDKQWKQANPRDQAIALLSAMEGTISNVQSGIYLNPKSKLGIVLQQLHRVQKLVKSLEPGKWEEP